MLSDLIKPGDPIVVTFADRKKSGTVKIASDAMIVVEEAPGFVFTLRRDDNLNHWACGKSSVMFTCDTFVARLRRIYRDAMLLGGK